MTQHSGSGNCNCGPAHNHGHSHAPGQWHSHPHGPHHHTVSAGQAHVPVAHYAPGAGIAGMIAAPRVGGFWLGALIGVGAAVVLRMPAVKAVLAQAGAVASEQIRAATEQSGAKDSGGPEA